MKLCRWHGHLLSFPMWSVCLPMSNTIQGTKHGEANPDDVVLVILLGELPYLRNCMFRTQVLPKVIFFRFFQVGIFSSRSTGGGHQTNIWSYWLNPQTACNGNDIIVQTCSNMFKLYLPVTHGFQHRLPSDPLMHCMKYSSSAVLCQLVYCQNVIPALSRSCGLFFRILNNSITTANNRWENTAEGKTAKRCFRMCYTINKLGQYDITICYVAMVAKSSVIATWARFKIRNSTEAGTFSCSTFSTSSHISSCNAYSYIEIKSNI